VSDDGALRRGVRLLGCDDDAIALSAGIGRARTLHPELPYRQAAFVPRPSWRAPTADERALFGDRPGSQAGTWLQLLRVPDAVLAPFAPLRELSLTMTDRAQLERHADSAWCRRAVAQAQAYLVALTQPGSDLEALKLFGNRRDLPTTTMVESSRLNGLHVDNWYQLPLPQRGRAPNRLAINLGASDRYFLFVNLTLAQMARRLRFSQDTTVSTVELRERFMAAHPRYPVVRVRMRPGEALIAPTENLIHDGCTIGHAGFDVRLSARGRFAPQMLPASPR
jgi:hypothetical protein